MLNHCVVMITKRLYKMSESVGTRPAERTEKVLPATTQGRPERALIDSPAEEHSAGAKRRCGVPLWGGVAAINGATMECLPRPSCAI